LKKPCNQRAFPVVCCENLIDLNTMRHSTTSLVTVLALAVISALAAPGAPLPDASKLPPAAAQTGLTFDKDIHPIFDKACVKCHGEDRPRASLRLDTLEDVMKGAKDRSQAVVPVVVPGDSAKSPLVFAVANIDGKVSMPPPPRKPRAPMNGATNAPTPPPPQQQQHPLTTEQVGLIRAWVDQGAK
jgi:hypothetical protein